MKSAVRPKYFIAVIAIATLLVINPSCKPTERVSREVKEAEDIQDQQEKEAIKEYDASVKKHRNQQSDYAKQLAKDMKKQRKRNNQVRKRSLWDRIFRNNCP